MRLRDSNPRPPALIADALPTELLRRFDKVDSFMKSTDDKKACKQNYLACKVNLSVAGQVYFSRIISDIC